MMRHADAGNSAFRGQQGDADALTRSISRAVRRAPLVVPAIGLCGGLAVGEALPLPIFVWILITIAAGAGLIVFGRRLLPATLCVALAATAAGGALYEATIRRAPVSDVGRFAGQDRRLVRLAGVVATQPVASARPAMPFKSWMADEVETEFLLACDRVETGDGACEVSGLLRVRVGEALLALRRGDRIEAIGWLYAFRPPANPGQFDCGELQHRRGVRAGFTCEGGGTIRVLRDQGRAGWWSATSWVRSAARAAVLDGVLPDDPATASLVGAIVLGARSRVERAVNDAFIRTGTSHFLSVSGAHVTLLALSLWGLLAMVGV